MLSCSINKTKSQETTPVIDSLLNVLKQLSSSSQEVKLIGADTLLVNTLNRLSGQYWNINNYEKGLYYGNEALKAAFDVNFRKGKAKAYNNIGLNYDGLGNYVKALESFENGQIQWTEIGNKREIAVMHNNMGNVLQYMGNYEKSLDNYLTALKLREELGDKKAMVRTYSNIGLIYQKQGNNKKALDIFFKCLKINQELENPLGIAAAENCIANVYFADKNYSGALEYYLKSLKNSEKINDKHGLANVYNNLGMVYDEKKDYKKALEHYQKSFKIKEEIGDLDGIAGYNLNVGIVYTKQGDFRKAKEHLEEGARQFKALRNKDGVKEAYESLGDLYEKQGDYKKAFDYHKLFSDLKDSLFNETSSKQIAEMNTKYESEKKEKDILLLTKDKELQHAEIGRQKLIRNGFVGGLAFALLLVFIIFNRFQITRKQKKIIEYQNAQIVESINYSKNIQDSLLPSIESMQKSLPSLFVFYEPKQIVSGDFYFFKEFKNYILLACVDCTGHGVPGGFMSTLGSLLLDKITNDELQKPSEILTNLNDEIIRILHQQSGGELQDGMDLSVCLIDLHNRKIEFSGARNGIIVVTNGVAKRYKASPLPVGGNYMKKGIPLERNFQTQSISLNTNDSVYMYTDGFIEQVGGTDGIPMNYEQFEKQLIAVSRKQSVQEKINTLQAEHSSWKGANEITDDMLILGFSVSN